MVARSVASWKDLEGQPIAIPTKFSLGAAAIKGRFQQDGIHGYTLVEIPIANMGLAVAGGNVAGALPPEPHLTQALERGDSRLLDWVIGGPPFDRMVFTMVAFRDDPYRNNPQAVKASLRTHVQAARWINQSPDRARSVLGRSLGFSQKFKLPGWPADARTGQWRLAESSRLTVDGSWLSAESEGEQC